MHKVPAAQGIHWVVTALRLFGRHFALLFMLGLLLVLLTQIPFLGSFIGLFLGPALLGGIVWATQQRQMTGGRSIGIGALFKAFDGSQRLPSLIALCLPAIGLFLLLIIAASGILAGSVGGDPAKLEIMQNNPALLLAALRGHLLPLLTILLLGALLNFALTFFAVPQVMLRQQGGFAAMGQSLRAVGRNWAALLLMLLGLIGLGVVASLALQIIFLGGGGLGGWWRLLALLVMLALMYSYSAVLMYVAWCDVFGDAPAAAGSAPGEVHAEM
ncbi:BPSS1780 family membrane protein [Metallibacterium sp.]|uniref:BPSS1780 family membrane protein n=1 Tax=Metallibacterium sp. TaxID=2940281 RepID=UPI002616A236|nr:BPSS1780 family membrane protein [Metallibacterium sp.]